MTVLDLDEDIAWRVAARINRRQMNRRPPVRRWFVSLDRYAAVERYIASWARRMRYQVRLGPNGGLMFCGVEIHSH